MAIHPKLVGHADASSNWQDAVTCAAFTPADNSLLVVFASAADANGSGPGTMAITDSEGLTWTQQETSAGTSTWEHSGWIFTAPVTTGASMTVTATHTPNTDTAAISMDVVMLPGYNAVEQTFKARVTTEAAYAGDFASALDSANSIKLAHCITHDRATGITKGSGWVTLLDETGESPHGWDSQTQYTTGTTDTGIDFANVGYDTYDAVILAIEVSAADGDPYFDDVVFLCNFDGSDGATSATDLSNSGHTITFNGNAQLDTADKAYGTASLLLDGSGDYISVADSVDFYFADGPFTIDIRVKQTTHAAGHLIQQYTSGQLSWWVFDGGSGKLRTRLSTDGSTVDYDTGNSGPGHTEGAWNILSIERDRTGKVREYINGPMVDSLTGATGTLHNSTAAMTIGSILGTLDWAGHIDEVRITLEARYANDDGYIPLDAAFPTSGIGGVVEAVGSASGAGSVTAAGASTAEGDGTLAGAATATAVGGSDFGADGSSDGSASVSAVGVSDVLGAGASSSASAIAGDGAAITEAVGFAAGGANVVGISTSPTQQPRGAGGSPHGSRSVFWIDRDKLREYAQEIARLKKRKPRKRKQREKLKEDIEEVLTDLQGLFVDAPALPETQTVQNVQITPSEMDMAQYRAALAAYEAAITRLMEEQDDEEAVIALLMAA